MPSPRIHWTLCLWPGLPHLWMRGSWVGLAVAVGFTALGNTLLLASFVYREWISGDALWIGYSVLAVVWLLAWWQSRTQRRQAPADLRAEGFSDSAVADRRSQQQDQWFREAQRRYLENDWIATEQLLLKLLKQNGRDVEARLLLATLWRHQGRRDEALRQLDRLQRLEAADKWHTEIAAEREQLQQATVALSEREETEVSEENNSTSERPNRRLAA